MHFGQSVDYIELLPEGILWNNPVALLLKFSCVVEVFWRPLGWHDIPPALGEFIYQLVLTARLRWSGLSLLNGFFFFSFCVILCFLHFWLSVFLGFFFNWLLFPIVLFCWVQLLNVLSHSRIA